MALALLVGTEAVVTLRMVALRAELAEAESILECALSLHELGADSWTSMMVERGRERVVALRAELEQAERAEVVP